MTDAMSNEIAEALAKAQAKMKNPVKNKLVQVRSQKGNYDFRYADLSACLDAVRGPLSEEGIALTQAIIGTVLRTSLIHKSGQALWCDYPLNLREGAGPQEVGSAITYGRRYGLVCLTGIVADDDDDGNAAEGNAAVVQDHSGRSATTSGSAAAGGPPAAPSATEKERDQIESTLTDLAQAYENAGKLDLYRTRYVKAGGVEILPKGQEHIRLEDVPKARFVVRKLQELKKTDLATGGEA